MINYNTKIKEEVKRGK